MLKKDYNIQVDKKKIVLSDGIKTTGRYEVEIKLYPNITAKLTVEVVGE